MRSRSSTQYLGTSLRKKLLRVLCFFSLALAILASVLMLGNILHDRLEKAAPLLSLPAISYTDLSAVQKTSTYTPHTPGTLRPGYYYAPAPSVLAKTESIPAFCGTAAELYSGISLLLHDGENLRFASKTPPADGSQKGLLPYESLTALLRASKEAALPCCAVWQINTAVPDPDESGNGFLFEIASLGFEEILFTTLSADTLNERTVAACASLAEALKKTAPRLLVGFAVEYGAFTDAELAPMLEKLAACADILAVDLGGIPAGEKDSAAFARTRAASLYGSIAYYPLRILVRGTEADASAQLRALQDAGIPAVQILG